jgi:phenylalanine-4-hydroxylase
MDDIRGCTIEQSWSEYSADEHAIWRLLFDRQHHLLVGRACREYLEGLEALGVAAGGIPDFRRLSDLLDRATGWRLTAVPGIVPDTLFFALLARRRFPSTCFIRRRDQLDYLAEPDVFHDICGHVPMLMNPVFADYMQAYGEGGLKALRLGHLRELARLYWYTVEFGLIATPEGLRI